MTNFNVQAFMDSLSAEMQEKVKACKTEEELAVLIEAEGIDLTAFAENEEDIELTLEDLDGVGGGRGFLQTALASVIMFTSAGAAVASPTGGTIFNDTAITASAADPGVIGEMGNYDFVDPIAKLAYDKAREYGLEYLDKGLTELLKNVPFGDSIKDLIKDQLFSVFGIEGEKTITTKDLSDKLDKLDEKMDEAFDKQTKELIAAMNRTAVVQKYKSDMDTLVATADVAAIISDSEDEDDLSEEDKLVKLAMVVGNSNTWSTTGSFMHAYTAVTNDMIGKSYSSDMDFFTALYEEQKANYQFSGEVLDVITPYIQKMILDYARYTTILLASLDAQEQLIYGDFDASKITDKQLKLQYESLMNDRTTIKKAKIVVSKNLFGSEAFTKNGISISKVSSIKLGSNNYDNVFVHLNKLLSTNRLIHIPTGRVLNPNLQTESGYRLINGDNKETEQFGLDGLESSSKEEFEKRITGQIGNYYNHNCFSAKQMEQLFEHVEKQIASGKYSSVVDYLDKMGFNVDPSWESTDVGNSWSPSYGWWIPTGGGYDERNYGWSFTETRYTCWIDAINLSTGKKESINWRSVYNNTGLVDLVCGDKIWCGANYIMFHDASEMTTQEANAEVEKKQAEAMKKFGEKIKLAAALADNYNFYYEKYPDLQAAFGHDTSKLDEHFRNYGIKEGRQFSKYFDLQYYLDNNPDVKAAFGGDYEKTLNHFLDYGVYEGRSPSPLYDSKSYAKAYPDLTPYERFENFLAKNNTINSVTNFIK
ncbi:hypothetical protein SAMN02910447_00276 [Ruminococcus sp. YE71]|uniref:hypothetical protein n=1 Tax=unclassified Ruminococcus TaxID=2608920 RepID=UPI0008806AC2|nr:MULTISPECIES: hypothetical protein [unclassified Ruminococcus]SDA09370.1 hypothetical protein SAMN02910446_00073 [Ruminococcus sp. YE78]SFW12433.1 hypothetical protein SAMN02910447_00276 [Ruminococcus sp. YE71]